MFQFEASSIVSKFHNMQNQKFIIKFTKFENKTIYIPQQPIYENRFQDFGNSANNLTIPMREKNTNTNEYTIAQYNVKTETRTVSSLKFSKLPKPTI